MQKLKPPSAMHWFGTDALGRDLYARIVYGSVHSLSGASVAIAVGLVLGTMLGVISGSIGGIVDDILMRIVDVLLAVPALLLMLCIIILLGFGTVNAALAVGVASVATFARLVRSEVIRVRRSEYVEAAFGSGGSFRAVLWRHVLPNSLTSALALAAIQLGHAILAISTLGFLGFGAPPPTPEWGLLIADGCNYISTSGWLSTNPGIVVGRTSATASAVRSERMRDEPGTPGIPPRIRRRPGVPVLDVRNLAIAYRITAGDAGRASGVVHGQAGRGGGAGGRIRLRQDHHGAVDHRPARR